MMTHQPPRAAVTNAGPMPLWADALTIEPITAMPRAAPTWRLVEAMAAATPAWERGMPETAVFVMGALTKPKPRPNRAYEASSHGYGVAASRRSSIRPDTVRAVPASSSGSRLPRRPTMRPDSGAQIIVATAYGRVARPASSGLRPRTRWR